MGLFGRKKKEKEVVEPKVAATVDTAAATESNGKRKLIVACGSGVATSQTIASKIQSMFEQDGISYNVEAVDYKSIESELQSASIYVFIAQPDADVLALAKKLNVKVFPGIPFLTGMGMDDTYEQIKALVK